MAGTQSFRCAYRAQASGASITDDAGKSRWENDESDSEEEEIPRKQSAISRIESIKSVSSLTDVKRLDSLEASEAGEAREAAEASPNDNDATEKERMLRETLLKRMEAKPAEPSEGSHSVDGTPPDSAVGGGAAVGAAAVAPSPSVGASGMLNLRGCRNVDQSFETFTRIDEGTYGVVFKVWRVASRLYRTGGSRAGQMSRDVITCNASGARPLHPRGRRSQAREAQ
jgi:hypothetical protein